jgi:hypothetical protein
MDLAIYQEDLLTISQPMQDYTPFIVDDSFDPSTFVGEHLTDQFQEGLLGKAGVYLPMSGYEKVPQREMIGMHHPALVSLQS